MAEYMGKRTTLAEDFIDDEYSDFSDYDEEADKYYAPEGWYEHCHGTDYNMHMGKVTVTQYQPVDLPRVAQ